VISFDLLCYQNGGDMPAITVRNLSDETHRALKARAAAHQRSTEAEVRAILDAAVRPPDRVRLGSLLAGIGQSVGGADLDVTRDPESTEPPTFE
jgi:plasmid stability protein